VRGWAARGAASLVGLWIGLALGPGRSCAAEVDTLIHPFPGDGAADGLPIARVEIEARGIFDPVPRGRLAPGYRLANRLHVRTRASTLRDQVLFAPGERWSEARAKESERALRALDIFNHVRVRGARSGDSAVVTVLTRDAWTTSPEFSLERGGGRLFGSFQLAERNLLGRAQYVAIAYREEPTGISRSVHVADPGVAGTRVKLSAGASGGSVGTTRSVALGMPFYSEDAPLSFGISGEYASTKARLFDSGVEVARFDRRADRVEAFVGRGTRYGRTIGRVIGSFLVWDRTFGANVPAPGAPPEFGGGDERVRVRRFAIEGQLLRPAFVERRRVDQLDGVEDFDLGRSLGLAAGFSARSLGGSANEGYAGLRMGAGVEARRAGFGWFRLGMSSRLPAGPREAMAQLDARWVNQAIPRHTLVLAALGAAGWRTERDFQLVVGGLNGLRAHAVNALAGDQLWRFNAESRWLIGREYLHVVSLGAAAFWDAARTWGPGSGDLAWQHDVGLGLRVSLPRSAVNRVARFDVAWPVSRSAQGLREAVFSFGSSQAF
jgi:surface antigen Omp85-like protein